MRRRFAAPNAAHSERRGCAALFSLTAAPCKPQSFQITARCLPTASMQGRQCIRGDARLVLVRNCRSTEAWVRSLRFVGSTVYRWLQLIKRSSCTPSVKPVPVCSKAEVTTKLCFQLSATARTAAGADRKECPSIERRPLDPVILFFPLMQRLARILSGKELDQNCRAAVFWSPVFVLSVNARPASISQSAHLRVCSVTVEIV
jgi:hypothetical protein